MIKHSGNFQSIESPRCAIDAIKYSRNNKEYTPQEIQGERNKEISNGSLVKLAPLTRITLDGESDLYLSHNPHSWFIAEHSSRPDAEALTAGVVNSDNLDQNTLSTLYQKGLLSINGIPRPISNLNGRYAVRSDNVALISVTDRCNLNCEHCVANANKNRLNGKELSLDELNKVFLYLSQKENHYGFNVEKKVFISGGDPTMRKDLESIALTCANASLSTHICTNALRIKAELLDSLRGKNIAFSVSLDGQKKNHEVIRGRGTFEPTLKRIRAMCERGYDVFINTFLHQDNISDMEYLLNIGAEMGIRGINFIRAIPRGRGKSMEFKRVEDRVLFKSIYDFMKEDATFYKILENENTFPILALSAVAGIKSQNCGLSRGNYFFLDSVGNLFPCAGTRYDEFLIGNIRNTEISTLDQKRLAHPLSELKVDGFPYCSACEFRYFCGGDCRGSAYGNSSPKDIKSPVPYCSERKDSLLEMFRILGRDPGFMRDKSEWIAKNAREETNKCN